MTSDSIGNEHSNIFDSTDWQGKLRVGDPELTNRLWDLYFHRMVRIARKHLRGAPTTARDEEDVALSAFKSFCLGIQAGRISIEPGNLSLWPLLVRITMNKAVDLIRHENRLKRAQNLGANARHRSDLVDELISSQPSPAMETAARETLERMLLCLQQTGNADLQAIAIASIEGSSTTEIAESIGCSPRTIQRKLKTIGALWEAEVDD